MAWRPAHHMWRLLHGQPAAIQSHIRWTPGQIGRPSCILRRYLAHDVLIQYGHREMGGRIVAAQAQKNGRGVPTFARARGGGIGPVPRVDPSSEFERCHRQNSRRDIFQAPLSPEEDPPFPSTLRSSILAFSGGLWVLDGYGGDRLGGRGPQIIGSPFILLQ